MFISNVLRRNKLNNSNVFIKKNFLRETFLISYVTICVELKSSFLIVIEY